MAKITLKLATRRSPLALWQANFVKLQLEKQHANLQIELLPLTTSGDKILTSSLTASGGKGLFVKELEQAILEKAADFAVHSMKDVPMELPPQLILTAICEREDPRDVMVSNDRLPLAKLPANATVGTSSLRRSSQLLALRSDLKIKPLRGNIETRLSRLSQDNFAAIILAAAGLLRLNLEHSITQYFSTTQMIPAVGQGALGIECEKNNLRVREILSVLNHEPTEICVKAERALNEKLEGGCSVPIGAYAYFSGEKIQLDGFVGSADGRKILRANRLGEAKNPEKLGIQVAEELLDLGALKILHNE